MNSVVENTGIVADDAGNCFITGFITGQIDFDPSVNEVPLQGNPSDNYFVAAYNPNGDYKWAFKIGVTNVNYETPNISLGKNSVYLFGIIPADNTDLDPGPAVQLVAGNPLGGNSFVGSYDKDNGSYKWGFGYASNNYYNSAYKLSEDSLNDVVLSGYYSGPIDLDPGPGNSTISGYGKYLAKYSSNGSFIWGHQELPPGFNSFNAFSMQIDPENNILRSGGDYSADSFNVAVVKYKPDGSQIWNFKLSHYGGHDGANGLVTDNLGNFYISGMYDGTVDFDPGSGIHNLTSVGGQDGFFAKYKDNTAVLPVALVNFSGEAHDEQNLLHWATVTEQNNTGFEVQRSTDANNFSKISFVNTKANSGISNKRIAYDFGDGEFTASTNYYRLKQIDKDGKFAYSNIVLLRDDNSSSPGVSIIYPNPTKNILNVKISSPANGKITLTITDLTGRLLSSKTTRAGNGDTIVQLNIALLPAGNYYLKVHGHNDGKTAAWKFAKL